MKVLHLLAAGGTGGIEVLIRDIIEDETIDNRVCVLFKEGEIYEEIQTNKNKIFSLVGKSKNEMVNELASYCKQEKIDTVVVHHGGISINLIYIKLKNKIPHINYIRYFHSSYDKYWKEGNIIKFIMARNIMQRAINKSDALIFISNAVQRTFENSFKINNKKRIVIYNGISNKFFESEKKDDIRLEKSFIYIGRLISEKGVDILIKAFSKVYNKDSETILTIVGEGPERENLEKLTKNSIFKDNVKFVGRQNNVIEWLDRSSIFIYPSIWEEGFGISVVEAMSRGCIPITFRKGGLVEIIKDKENGYLVDNTSDNDLAKMMFNVIEMSEQEKEEIRKNAIKTAKEFSIDNTKRSLKEFYSYLNNMEGQDAK